MVFMSMVIVYFVKRHMYNMLNDSYVVSAFICGSGACLTQNLAKQNLASSC